MLRTLRGCRCLALLLFMVMLGSGCGSQSNAAPTYTHRDPENNVVMAGSPIPTQAGPANPSRLVIPAIGVNAAVEEVGMLANGDLGTPGGSPWVDTGWYNQGPHPGQQGSAVIDGHLDRPGGSPAVFWRLRDLRRGNEVQVTDRTGKTLHFSVTDVEYYEPQNAPIQEIFGNTNGKYLNLITCAGDWIPSQNQTTLRLVVYTTLIS
jgi:sortase (surface protein transpeptidase)